VLSNPEGTAAVTKDELTLGASSVLRHLATLGAGVLAAHGLAGGDQLASIAGSVGVFLATIAWSLISKNRLVAELCDALPVSELESLGKMLASFRAQGSNPLLVANIAQTAMAVAQQELLAAHPELAAPKPAQTPPPPPPPPVPATVAPVAGSPAAVAETDTGAVL
jgi:hypothetical protein